VPFFAEVADRLFERFVAEGVQFIPLEEAVADPAYEQVGRVASDKFLIYQQKLADLAGRSLPSVAPEIQHLHESLAKGLIGPNARSAMKGGRCAEML
jgi:peptidoglycan-N-acetylglucosamine deacetylase